MEWPFWKRGTLFLVGHVFFLKSFIGGADEHNNEREKVIKTHVSDQEEAHQTAHIHLKMPPTNESEGQ